MDVQWYPGHMARAARSIKESLKNVDVVCELSDSRIPIAGRNPYLKKLSENKPSLLVLNRCDLADEKKTLQWIQYFNDIGQRAVAVDCKRGVGIDAAVQALHEIASDKLDRFRQRGMTGRAVKIMVAGIPNIGKSSFINRVLSRNSAKAENRPGVTRQNAWFALGKGLELLDTPGTLPPKIDNNYYGLLLAFTGAVKDSVIDLEELAAMLAFELSVNYAERLANRYGVEFEQHPEAAKATDALKISFGFGIVRQIADRRGFRISGGALDTERASRVFIEEFRCGKLGRITLETPYDTK